MRPRSYRIERHGSSDRADAGLGFVPLIRHDNRAKVNVLWGTAKAETTLRNAQDVEKRLSASRSRSSLRRAVAGLRLAKEKRRHETRASGSRADRRQSSQGCWHKRG